MAYIYKKTVHGRLYYYLRISKRIKGKIVVKDVAYLGNSPKDVEKKLDKLPQYQKEIRKGYKNIKRFIQKNHYLEKVRDKKIKRDKYMDKEIFEEIEAIRLHYTKYFLKLDDRTKKEAYQHFLIDFAFNTTSIEGNTITLKEARNLLQEDILPKKRKLREVYDLQNTENIFWSLQEKNPRMSEALIMKVHDGLLDRIDDRKGYRTTEIRIFLSRFNATPAKYIQTDMRLLLDWFDKHKKKLHPLVLASMLHHKLEKIHPFADGNGRTGRIMMNHVLMRNRYPPLIVAKKRRDGYLEALRAADRADLKSIDQKHYAKLVDYLAKELISSYWENFNL